MKLLVGLAATFLTIWFPLQDGPKSPPDLMVVKFTCARYERGAHMIRSVQDVDTNNNEPIRINQMMKNEPQEVINRRDMQERRAGMRAAEINAELSKQKGTHLYHYRLEVQNTNAQPIKSFAWSYQTGEAPDPADRQFFCAIDAKPKENKLLDLYSPLGPARVIDASKAGEKPEKDEKLHVMINLIEYADGSVWKRPAWNPAMFSKESKEKVEHGKCIGL
jgi:hypothetical protein